MDRFDKTRSCASGKTAPCPVFINKLSIQDVLCSFFRNSPITSFSTSMFPKFCFYRAEFLFLDIKTKRQLFFSASVLEKITNNWSKLLRWFETDVFGFETETCQGVTLTDGLRTNLIFSTTLAEPSVNRREFCTVRVTTMKNFLMKIWKRLFQNLFSQGERKSLADLMASYCMVNWGLNFSPLLNCYIQIWKLG